MNALTIEIPFAPVPSEQVVDGAPQTGFVPFPRSLSLSKGAGAWAMTPGTMTDTEASEVFVVVAGRGRVDFIDPPLPSIDLTPGAIVRLDDGQKTVWTVTETLRKVYLS
ncbi:MAG: cupin domain-containing protein [Microbacterium sp.]